MKAPRLIRKTERDALIAKTNKRFWQVTGYGARLDPANPADRQLMPIWMDMYRELRDHRGPKKSAKMRLVQAARAYGLALKRQHAASAAMTRAQTRRKRVDATVLAFEAAHNAACDALGAAEHELLICAAIVGDWTRKSARRSV
jgi:hypothetical protein